MKTRKLTEREIEKQEEYIALIEKLKPKNKQMLADYEKSLQDKKNNWVVNVGQNVGGICL